MATIKIKQLKDGTWSDTVQVKVKNPVNNKFIFKSHTYKRPENIKTKKELERYLSLISSQYENRVRIDMKKRLEEKDSITFSEIAYMWHQDCYSKRSANYYHKTALIIDFLNQYLGEKLVKEITSSDVQKIFFDLNTYQYSINKGVLIKSLDNVIGNKKIKDICDNSGISKTTLQCVRKGSNIDWETALKLSKTLNINVNAYFQKSTETKKYAQETKLKYKRTLCAILNFAVKYGYLFVNYASGVYTKDALVGEKKEKIILNENETLKLEKSMLKLDCVKKKAYIAVLLYLGLRNCEACGLEWKDVNFANNKIHIQRDSVYIKELGIHTRKTKNKSSNRILTIPQKLIPILKELKEWQDKERENRGDKWVESDRLFIRDNGEACNPTSGGKWLKEVLLENNLKLVSPHSLRHTNITMLLRANVPVKIVSRWAGHSNPDITLKIYAHYLDEDEEVCSNCINSIFDE